MTEEQKLYLLDHDRMFYEGWKCGIETAEKSMVENIEGFINRALPAGDYEYLQATEKRGGFFGYWVARLDNTYIRGKLSSLLHYLEAKQTPSVKTEKREK